MLKEASSPCLIPSMVLMLSKMNLAGGIFPLLFPSFSSPFLFSSGLPALSPPYYKLVTIWKTNLRSWTHLESTSTTRVHNDYTSGIYTLSFRFFLFSVPSFSFLFASLLFSLLITFVRSSSTPGGVEASVYSSGIEADKQRYVRISNLAFSHQIDQGVKLSSGSYLSSPSSSSPLHYLLLYSLTFSPPSSPLPLLSFSTHSILSFPSPLPLPLSLPFPSFVLDSQ